MGGYLCMGGLSVLPLLSEFCVWVQVGIDIHIAHRKYQVEPHSSP